MSRVSTTPCAPRRIACTRSCAILGGLFVAAAMAHAQAVPTARIVEDLRLDGIREDFSAISGGVKTGPRGDIALTLRQDAQVRIYDSSGKRLAVVGRRGSGPGEFRGMQVEGWIADTVWIYDYVLRRHTFVTRNGNVVRTSLASPALQQGSGLTLLSTFSPHGRARDGSMLGLAMVSRTLRDGRTVKGLAIVHASPTDVVTFVADAPSDEARWEFPFSLGALTGFSDDGALAVVVQVSDMVRAGGIITVSRFSPQGFKGAVTTVPYRGVPMSRRFIDSTLAAVVDVDGRHQSVPSNRIPPVYPPVESVLVLPSGSVWLVLRSAESARIVLIINPTGAVAATFELPPHATLAGATATHAWLKITDDDGVTSAVRYRVRCGTTNCP